MTSMRTFLDMVEPSSNTRIDSFVRFSQRPIMLREGRQALSEGSLGAKINAVTKRVHDQYGDIQAAFLTKATMRALDTFGKGQSANPQVAAALGKVLTVAKFAVQNRALLSVLLGIVSTLIGIATHPSPAGATEASQLDQLLQGQGLDDIINKLHQSGIDVGTVDASALPQGVSGVAAKAAKALAAIERYKFVSGGKMSSSQDLMQSVSVVGNVTKTGSFYHEVIDLKTNDGKVTLCHIETSYKEENGVMIDDPSETGVQFELDRYIQGKTPAETDAAQDYLSKALDSEHSQERQASGMQEGVSDVFSRIKQMLTGKVPDLGRLVAQAVAGKPDGNYKITLGSNGVSVIPG